jgi:hypothetical protein
MDKEKTRLIIAGTEDSPIYRYNKYHITIETKKNPKSELWRIIDTETKDLYKQRGDIRNTISSRNTFCKEAEIAGIINKDECKKFLNMVINKIPDYNKEENGEEQTKKTRLSCFVKDNGQLYEQIYRDGEMLFLTINGDNEETVKIIDDVVPIESDAVKKGVVLLPDCSENYGNIESLVKRLQEHINKYLDISEDHEIFACYYILLSWLYDKTETLNYMRALGDYGSGKSRYLDVIGRLCYKPILVVGALTTPVLYRMLDLWGGTLVMDEGDFKKSDEQADIMKIFNAGFEKSRAAVIRCNPNDPKEIETFAVYGPKVISSRKNWNDLALESRCLTERMLQTAREDILPVLGEEYYESELNIRRMLLKFRFDYYGEIKYEYKDLGITELEPRLKQAVSSFTVLFQNIPELLGRFKEFIKKYNENLIEERSESYEGMITQGLFYHIMDGNEHITSKTLSDYMKDEFDVEYNSRGVGKLLKSLGFDSVPKKVEGKTKRVIKLDDCILKIVAKRYLPIGHEFRKDGYMSYISYMPIRGGTQNVTKGKKRINGYIDTPTPHNHVTNVTHVTKLEKWKESEDGRAEIEKGLLKTMFGFTDKEIIHLKEQGLIHSPHPGKYMVVR